MEKGFYRLRYSKVPTRALLTNIRSCVYLVASIPLIVPYLGWNTALNAVLSLVKLWLILWARVALKRHRSQWVGGRFSQMSLVNSITNLCTSALKYQKKYV